MRRGPGRFSRGDLNHSKRSSTRIFTRMSVREAAVYQPGEHRKVVSIHVKASMPRVGKSRLGPEVTQLQRRQKHAINRAQLVK